MGGGGGGVIKSASDPATTATAGDLWSDTDNEKLYRRNDANDAWLELANYPVAGDEAVNDYSTTIGDYDQAITTATASNNDSSAFSYTADKTGSTNALMGTAYGNGEVAYLFGADFEGIGAVITTVKLRLKRRNNWDGYVRISIDGSTCSDNNTSEAFPTVTSLTTSYATKTFTHGGSGVAIEAGNYLSVYAWSVNNYYVVDVEGGSGNPTGLTSYTNTSPAGCAAAGSPMYLELTGTANHLPTNAISGSTGTFWQSTAAANNWLRLDLGSAKDITAMTIYLDTTVTTETQFLIQSSPDGSDWTTLRTINKTALTNAAYNYIRFNPVNARYFRIYGNSGSSTIMKINEVDLQPFAIDSHGHFGISGTNAALALNGT